ncbi:MAG: extracellular solute-binding protein [Clostridiales bacterium]|nr:extracellular solute-binding protein [Clostridiales bacterium]
MKKILSLVLVLAMLASLPVALAADEEPYEFSLMINFGADLDDAGKAYIAMLEEACNVKLDLRTPAGSAYAESLQMMIASGDYADLVLFPDAKQVTLRDGAANGLYLALNDLLPNYPNIMKYTHAAAIEEAKILKDGNIYAVPRCTVTRADGFAIRQDWLDALNITIPENGRITTDELYNILYAIVNSDPDGNGKKDTYGYSAYTNGGDITPQFQWAFGLLGWQEYDGEYMDLMYSKDHDNFKRCLAFNAKLWADGLFDPDWPTIQTSSVMLDRFRSGVVGMVGRFAGHMIQDLPLGQAIDPDFDLGYITGIVEKEEDKDSYKGANWATGSWGFWGISSFAEHPEKILAFLDYLLSDEGWNSTKWGPEGVTWKMVDGVPTPTELYNTNFVSRNFARRSTDASFFVHINMEPDFYEATLNRLQICVDQNSLTLDMGYQPDVLQDPIYLDYVKYMKVEIAKIITGARPVDDWDEILDGWYEAGGDEYVAEMQEYIASQQGK